MTKLNWDRVRTEDLVRRHGWEPDAHPPRERREHHPNPPGRTVDSKRPTGRWVKCDQCPILVKAKNLQKHIRKNHNKSTGLSSPPVQSSSAIQRPAPAVVSRKVPEMISISRLAEELRPNFYDLIVNLARAEGARTTSSTESVSIEIAEKIRRYFKRIP